MAVRFILGRAGTGKTRHCLEAIRALLREQPIGPPIFWLVPRQATFQAERELTATHGAFTRARIVGFDELGQQILESCGDVGIPQLTALGRRLIIAHLLRQHQDSLKFYRDSARRPGLAAELDATFGEFERAGLDAAGLEAVLQTTDLDPALRDKLADVHLLVQAYARYANSDRLDQQQRMMRVLEQVEKCSLLKDATVFVDDFFEFRSNEQKLLIAVAKASRRTEITLLIDPDSPVRLDPHRLPTELSLFHRTERTYRSLLFALLKETLRVEPPLLLRTAYRFLAPDLATVERDLFNVAAAPTSAATSAVQWLDAPDPRTEVDAVARRIGDAAQSGVRWREMAVLVRGIDTYQPLIDACFAEHGIAYFVDRRRTAAHHPLLQFVRALLQIAVRRWPHDAVMTLLKSGLAGVTNAEADALESYVLVHRLRGNAWTADRPWTFRRQLTRRRVDPEHDATAETSDPAAAADALRRKLTATISPLAALLRGTRVHSMTELLTGLAATLEAFAVRDTLASWILQAEQDRDLQQRAEHEQVWTNFSDLLTQIHELLGPEPITAQDFLSAMESGLERFDLATAPPTLDAVLVGQVDRTRTPELKQVFVLGLAEGTFPARISQDCVLSDRDRRSLQKQSIEIDADSARQLLDERLLAYRAFTAASQQLVVTRPLADARGRAANPSAFWHELQALFPTTDVAHEPRPSACVPSTLSTPRQLVTALMRWVRSPAALCGPVADPSPPWPALYQWLTAYQCCDDALDTMRFRAWRALAYDNHAALDPATAAALFPSPLQASAGQLEAYAACPFKHFARYGLRLESRESARITGLDLNQAYHQVLERLVGDVVQRREDWCELPPAELHDRIARLAVQIGRSLRGEVMLSSARNRYLLDRIESTLRDVVAGQCEMHGRGHYRPAFAGLGFGPQQQLPAHQVRTPGGRQVEVFGRIDRVDLNAAHNAFSVFDYRFATGGLPLDRVYHGLNLQLLTYLIVMQESGAALTGRPIEPAAGFLLGLLRLPQTVQHPDEAVAPEDRNFHLQVKPRGIVREEMVRHFDRELGPGASPVIHVRMTKDNMVGWRGTSDVATDAEFASLLGCVDRRIGELADRLMSGDIEVRPYWLNQETPCPTCDYRSVCRFEPGINSYRVLPGMRREQLLVQLGGVNDGE